MLSFVHIDMREVFIKTRGVHALCPLSVSLTHAHMDDDDDDDTAATNRESKTKHLPNYTSERRVVDATFESVDRPNRSTVCNPALTLQVVEYFVR